MTHAPCTCVEKVNAKLGDKHRLDTAIMFSANTLTERPYSKIMRRDNGKAETRRGEPSVFGFTYCPFCGEPYEALPAVAAIKWDPIDQAPRDGSHVQLADEGGNRAVAAWVEDLGWAWTYGEGERPVPVDFVPTRFRALSEEEARP